MLSGNTASITFEIVDASGNQLASAAVGQSNVFLEVIAQDTSGHGSAGGIFSAFFNGTYDASKVAIAADNPALQRTDPNQPTLGYVGTFAAPATPYADWGFSNYLLENTTTAGQLTGIGGIHGGLPAPGSAPQILWSVPLSLTHNGSATFTPSFDGVVGHEVNEYGSNTVLTASQITFVPATLSITPAANSADLSAALSDNRGGSSFGPTTGTAVPGAQLSYTAVVTNNGPSAVFGATIYDVLPAAITSDTYTATAEGGATGFTSTGSGNIADIGINMPSGSSITYVITANVSSTATGSLSNTATVTVPAGTTDPVFNNNTATDVDSLATPPTVSIAAVTPNPRNAPVSQIDITFSQPVYGFTLSDLALTRGGGTNLLGKSQTLVSGDQIHWTLGNLATLTAPFGSYVLSLGTAGITNSAGLALVAGASTSFKVAKSAPAATLKSSENPAPYGQLLTFSLILGPATPGAAAPTGNVTFTNTYGAGSATLSPVTYSTANGSYVASVTLTHTFAPGSHLITAAYGGDAHYLSASQSLTQTVAPLAPSVSLVTSANPAITGQSLSITMTLGPDLTGEPAPTGTVLFTDTYQGIPHIMAGHESYSVVNGQLQATLPLPQGLQTGTHYFTAAYGGDGYYYSAVTASLVQIVNPSPKVDKLDVNGDGLVTPVDAIIIINRLNAAVASVAATASAPNPLDVNHDGVVTPIDALIVINYLNTLAKPAGLAAVAAPAGVTPIAAVNANNGGLIASAAAVVANPASDPNSKRALDVVFAGFAD